MGWVGSTSIFGRTWRPTWPRAAWSQAEAQELLEEFFISLNKDSDLYPGVQQGDNGQSLMLGGVSAATAATAVNPLTAMALQAARNVALIDPKINLRVNTDTDLGLLAQGVQLTRIGLGFPQWCNDEVVIPGLVAAGYDLEDARDYSVAACWEFIIPGKGMEVVNIGAVSDARRGGPGDPRRARRPARVSTGSLSAPAPIWPSRCAAWPKPAESCCCRRRPGTRC